MQQELHEQTCSHVWTPDSAHVAQGWTEQKPRVYFTDRPDHCPNKQQERSIPQVPVHDSLVVVPNPQETTTP